MQDIEMHDYNKEELVSLIKDTTKRDLNSLVRDVIRSYLKQEKDPKKIQELFSYVYDNIYHDLLFKKLPLHKQTAEFLETLAIPISRKTEEEQKLLVRDILKKIG